MSHNAHLLAANITTCSKTHSSASMANPSLNAEEIPENENQIQPIRKPRRLENKSIKGLKCDPEQLCHLRLQHPSASTLKKLSLIESNYDTSNCLPCIRAKRHRQPSNSHLPKAKRVLERIHSDICGPFSDSKGKSKYLFTFLDDFTHFAKIVTIPDKNSSTLSSKIAQYIKESERFHSQKVVFLHADRGTEYLGDVKALFQSLGVQLEPTVGYSPQSNGNQMARRKD
jgi:Integrase core domain